MMGETDPIRATICDKCNNKINEIINRDVKDTLAEAMKECLTWRI